MSLSFGEKSDLIERFKDRDIESLTELSDRFKANKHDKKAAIIDLILKVKAMDSENLKKLKKEFKHTDHLAELNYINSVLDSIKAEKRRKKKTKPDASFGLSKDVCQAMAGRIIQDAKKHRSDS